MSQTEIGATRRLQRLERVLAGRRARLASKLAAQPLRPERAGPLIGLQRYGYVAALLLALTATAPTVLGFALRRRRLLIGAAMNGVGIRKLRKRFDAARAAGSGR